MVQNKRFKYVLESFRLHNTASLIFSLTDYQTAPAGASHSACFFLFRDSLETVLDSFLVTPSQIEIAITQAISPSDKTVPDHLEVSPTLAQSHESRHTVSQ